MGDSQDVSWIVGSLGGPALLEDEVIMAAWGRLWSALAHGQVGFRRGAPEAIDQAARAIFEAGLCGLPQVAPVSLREEIMRAGAGEDGGLPSHGRRADPKIFSLGHNLGQMLLQESIVRRPVHPLAQVGRAWIEAVPAWQELHRLVNTNFKRMFPKAEGAFRVELHILQCVNDLLLAWFLAARIGLDLDVVRRQAAIIGLLPDCLVYGREVPHANVWVVIFA